ncbi:MAG: hypothetical protein JWM12_1438 [Ilumatobacteraceae bacterium]|nr:hypothetical protein [Ilumatobacteraceae bacterium]
MDIEVSPAESAGSQRQSVEPATSGVARRRLLGLGLGGAAAALVPAIAGRAAASTPPTSDATSGTGGTNGTLVGTTTADAATTTTAPPKRPTDADIPMLNFVQSAELSAYRLYKMALTKQLDETQLAVVEVITQAHLAYAQALSGLLGRVAANKPNQDLIDSMSSAFGGDVAGMLDAARTLESTLVATHIGVVGQLIGTDAAYALASIVTVEGRYGTVLADLAGAKDLSALLVDKEAAALKPAGVTR